MIKDLIDAPSFTLSSVALLKKLASCPKVIRHFAAFPNTPISRSYVVRKKVGSRTGWEVSASRKLILSATAVVFSMTEADCRGARRFNRPPTLGLIPFCSVDHARYSLRLEISTSTMPRVVPTFPSLSVGKSFPSGPSPPRFDQRTVD